MCHHTKTTNQSTTHPPNNLNQTTTRLLPNQNTPSKLSSHRSKELLPCSTNHRHRHRATTRMYKGSLKPSTQAIHNRTIHNRQTTIHRHLQQKIQTKRLHKYNRQQTIILVTQRVQFQLQLTNILRTSHKQTISQTHKSSRPKTQPRQNTSNQRTSPPQTHI